MALTPPAWSMRIRLSRQGTGSVPDPETLPQPLTAKALLITGGPSAGKSLLISGGAKDGQPLLISGD